MPRYGRDFLYPRIYIKPFVVQFADDLTRLVNKLIKFRTCANKEAL